MPIEKKVTRLGFEPTNLTSAMIIMPLSERLSHSAIVLVQ